MTDHDKIDAQLQFEIHSLIKNLKILKHIECCNFQIITEMYIKVYISGMEMSQRIHFWYQILLKMMIFEKMAKNTFLVKNFVTS